MLLLESPFEHFNVSHDEELHSSNAPLELLDRFVPLLQSDNYLMKRITFLLGCAVFLLRFLVLLVGYLKRQHLNL
jgi:hypothetical protein